MATIRESILTAIERSNAITLEERNRIYLAARDAIHKLPTDHAEIAMVQLLDVVKELEAEFVKHGLESEPPFTEPEYHSHLPPEVENPKGENSKPYKPKSLARSIMGLPIASNIKGLSIPAIPWHLVAVGAFCILVMAQSGYLLFERFKENGNADAEQTQQSGTAQGTADDQSIEELLSFNSAQDISVLSRSPDGSLPMPSVARDNTEKTALALDASADIFSATPFRLVDDKLYLIKFVLIVEGNPNDIVVSAGLSSISEDPSQPGIKKVLYDYVVHNGIIQTDNRSGNQNHYLFSSLVQRQDISETLALDRSDGLVRPAILVRSTSDGSKVWLGEFSMKAL